MSYSEYLIRFAAFCKENELSSHLKAIKCALLKMPLEPASASASASASAADWLLWRNGVVAHLESHTWSDRVRDKLVPKEEGLPFTEFKTDPANISQLKKIVNALYLAEKIVRQLEAMPPSVYQAALALKTLWFSDEVYQLCRLLSEPDVDLIALFAPEWRLLEPWFNFFATSVSTYSSDVQGFLTETSAFSSDGVFNKLGLATGLAVHQLKPQSGVAVDYSSMASFFAKVPIHLNRVTSVLSDASVLHNESLAKALPGLDPAKLKELKDSAEWLRVALVSLRPGGVIQLPNTMYVIRIMRQIHTLFISIKSEITVLGDESQHFIRSYLGQLKNILSQLVAFMDKVEEETMLSPGTWSTPLLTEVGELYASLVSNIRGWVSFTAHPGLQTLEDSVFTENRLRPAYQRQAEHRSQIGVLGCLMRESHPCFEQLTKHKQKPFARLVPSERSDLIRLYGEIQDEVKAVDVGLSNILIRWLTGETEFNSCNLMDLQNRLLDSFSKRRATHTLHIGLIEDFIGAAYRSSKNITDVEVDCLKRRLVVPVPVSALVQKSTTIFSVDREGEGRAGFLIQKPTYAAFIETSGISLWTHVMGLLTEPVKAHLCNTGAASPFSFSTLPFNEKNISEGATQTVSLKRLANGIFHLKQAAQAVESLETRSRIDYMTKVGHAFMAMYETYLLILELKSNPELELIKTDLMGRLGGAQQKLQTIQGLYNPPQAPESVNANPRDVVFSIVHALGLIPAHITSGRSVLSGDDQRSSIAYAEQVSSDVSRIITGSHSYVKLILETPTFLRLFSELGDRYTRCANTMQDTVIGDLQAINETYCSAILLEADEWEARLSLKPGLLADPLKQMLDVYYKGLLEPLNLSLTAHVKLATSRVSFDKRKASLPNALLRHEPTDPARQATYALGFQIAKSQSDYLNQIISTQSEFDNQFRKDLITKEIRSQVKKSHAGVHRKVIFNSKAYDEELLAHIEKLEDAFVDMIHWTGDLDEQVNRWLEKTIREFEAEHLPVYYQLEGVYKAIHHLGSYISSQNESKCLGNETGQTWALETPGTLYVKAELLSKLQALQTDHSLTKNERIIKFRELLDTPTFKNELLAFDTSNDSTFLWFAKSFVQIYLCRTTRQALYDELLTSVTDPQIDRIGRTISELEMYIAEQTQSLDKASKAWVFESKETLGAKKVHVDKLKELFQIEEPNHKKIEHISDYVRQGTFQADLLQYKEYDEYTFSWLINKILTLFEALHLYKPTLRVACDQLLKSVAHVTPPVLMRGGRAKHSFFSYKEPDDQDSQEFFECHSDADDDFYSDSEP